MFDLYSQKLLLNTNKKEEPKHGIIIVTGGVAPWASASSTTNICLYSTDSGLSWNTSTLPFADNYYGCTYAFNRLITFPLYNYNYYCYSEDFGVTWKTASMPFGNNRWGPVAFNGKRIVVLSYSTSNGAYSDDGINWTLFTMPIKGYWSYNTLIYAKEKFFALPNVSGNNTILSSTDGINWTTHQLPSGLSNGFSNIAFVNNKFYATYRIGDYESGLASSTDGINWTLLTTPIAQWWSQVIYGNGQYVLLGGRGSDYVAISTDGINWTTHPKTDQYSVVAGFVNGNYIQIGSGSTIDVSQDGINWTNVLTTSVNWTTFLYV